MMGTFRNQEPGQPLLTTVMGAMMISFSAVWVKLAQVAPTVSAFYRVGLGSTFLLVLLLFRRQHLWHGWSCLGWALAAAAFFGLDLWAWHRCIGYVGPGLATVDSQAFLSPQEKTAIAGGCGAVPSRHRKMIRHPETRSHVLRHLADDPPPLRASSTSSQRSSSCPRPGLSGSREAGSP